MEFIINNECFNKAISDVSKAVSAKSPLPILSGIKIIANRDSLTLIGSNSDIVIEKMIPLMIDGTKVLEILQTGSVVLSAKYLSEIVKKLPSDVHVKVNEGHSVTIQSDEVLTHLVGYNSLEYPSLPQIDQANYIKISSSDLIELIKQTVFAVSKNEAKPVLTGVHMSFQGDTLLCAATDSHRLAIRKMKIDSNVNDSFVVPSTSLHELTKVISHESGVIHIYLTQNYIVFKSNTISLYSRLIEGKYPNITGLLPKDSKTTIILNTKQFLKGIDRACLFASEWKNNNVHLEIKNGTRMRISSHSSQVGKIEETQKIVFITGETELTISLDGNFMMDALKAISDEEVKISFGGSMRPVLIEPIEHSAYLHLISPVRTY